MKVVELSTEKAKDQDAIVALCEALLECAQKGTFKQIFFAYEKQDGTAGSQMVSPSHWTMLGIIETAKHDLIDELSRGAVNEL